MCYIHLQIYNEMDIKGCIFQPEVELTGVTIERDRGMED